MKTKKLPYAEDMRKIVNISFDESSKGLDKSVITVHNSDGTLRWIVEIIEVGDKFGVKETYVDYSLFPYKFGPNDESISELGSTREEALMNFLKVETDLINMLG